MKKENKEENKMRPDQVIDKYDKGYKTGWENLHWLMIGLVVIVLFLIGMMYMLVVPEKAEAHVTVSATVPLTIYNTNQCLPLTYLR